MKPLIVDVYEGDGQKDWGKLARTGAPWCGAILKATQGTYYNGGSWFVGQWQAVAAAGTMAGRTDWRRGAYHYFDARLPGRAQADYFLTTIERAGGRADKDILMVDVERADQRAAITGGQVVNGVTEFVQRIVAVTGRWVMLYGGSWLYELGVTSRMACRHLAIARYTPDLPPAIGLRIGWGSAALWQYCGVDGHGHPVSYRQGYPMAAPGCGYVDISSVELEGGLDALESAPA